MGINMIRREIILKGYASVTDIMKFFQVGRPTAKNIYDEISEEIHKEGKKVNILGIHPSWLLKYGGLSEKKVLEYALLEESINDKDGKKN